MPTFRAKSAPPRSADTDGIIRLRFPHSKDDLRKIEVADENGVYQVYRLAPIVADWPAASVPDKVNPRSHDEECLRTSVAKAIEETLRTAPQDFWLANRGGYLLANRVKFDPDRSMIEIILTDLDLHGMADGATTNAVIKKVQEEWSESEDPDLGDALSTARYNLDVVVGLNDRERIAKLVEGRNTSRQVKPWSLSDFQGKFDWLKELIDRPKGPFKGKIGWEENAGKPVSVLDLISIMLLFHPIYDDPVEKRRRSPTVAFSSKGGNDKRLVDEGMAAGFRKLEGVLEDLLKLHDYVYANFYRVYTEFCRAFKGTDPKLGKRRGFEHRSTTLPLTGEVSEYRIDKGIRFPLLGSCRCILDFSGEQAEWLADPKTFFDDYGLDLMALLFEQYDLCGRNPATVGKSRAVYAALYNQARLLYSESDDAASDE